MNTYSTKSISDMVVYGSFGQIQPVGNINPTNFLCTTIQGLSFLIC